MKEDGLHFDGAVPSPEPKLLTRLESIGSNKIDLYVVSKLDWASKTRFIQVEADISVVDAVFYPSDRIATGQQFRLNVKCSQLYRHKISISFQNSETVYMCQKSEILHPMVVSTAGNYNVVVASYNNVSMASQTYDLIVENPIEASVAVVTANSTIPTNTTANFTAVSNNRLPDGTINVRWTVNNKTLTQYNVTEMASQLFNISTFKRQFSNPGSFDVGACVYNLVTESCGSITVHVFTVITGLSIRYANTSYIIRPGYILTPFPNNLFVFYNDKSKFILRVWFIYRG